MFFDPMPNSPCLIYYMRSASKEQAIAVAQKSTHAIDEYHKAFKSEAWMKVERMELLLDLCRP